MAVQHIDIARAICGKNIANLKGKKTRKNPIHMAGYIVIIPKDLIKLHKYVFMTADILLINGIPFFI